MAAIKCPICKNRKSCEIMGMGDSAIQSCGMYCTEEPPRRSKGDVIRAMTDEELADWVWGAETAGRAYGPRGKKAWLDWLKEEAET